MPQVGSLLGNVVLGLIFSALDHWVCDLGWSCGLHGQVGVLVLEEGVCSWVEVDQQALVQKEGRHG